SFFTVNHPARQTLRYVSEAVHSAVDLPYEDLGTAEPLDRIKTPVEEPVADVLGLVRSAARGWIIDNEQVSMETVFRAQLHFYREHPEVVAAAVEKHQGRLANLALRDSP